MFCANCAASLYEIASTSISHLTVYVSVGPSGPDLGDADGLLANGLLSAQLRATGSDRIVACVGSLRDHLTITHLHSDPPVDDCL